MKKLIVSNQELRLIEAGLELRNVTNVKILNGEHPRTTNLFGSALVDSARKEKEMIDKLREQIKEELLSNEDKHEKECCSKCGDEIVILKSKIKMTSDTREACEARLSSQLDNDVVIIPEEFEIVSLNYNGCKCNG